MENLNAEQIKKALGRCENECCDACTDCPSPPNTSGGCVVFVMRQALALIKELTEGNERLRAERDILDTLVKDLRARNKGLQSANESLAKDCDILEDELNECVQIKADTVRKMQERIKERCIKGGIYPAFVARTIEQIAKEMLEGG